MILMRENPFRGQRNEMATSKASAIWTQKQSRFSRATPSSGPSNGFSRIKIIKSKRHIKKQVYW